MSSGSRIDSCDRTDRRTGRTKLIAAFGNFVKALKKGSNKIMMIGPLTLSEYTGSAKRIFEFYCVGDQFEYGQGHRPHLMGILLIIDLVYKIRS